MRNSNATILIVDDEPENLDSICADLQQVDQTYELVRAGNGREAWSMLETDPDQFDAIILDRSLPNRSGFELLDSIRQHDSMTQLPVIMQTGADQDQTVSEGLRAGAYYYLTRPYDGETLKTIVRSAVNGRLHEKSLLGSLRAGRRIFELMSRGCFRIANLQEANLVALHVAHLCPEPERVVTGISELLLNALEHGNLKIGYREKSRLMRSGQWRQEVERRLQANPAGYVELEFDVNPRRIEMRIRDQGDGFNWLPYLEFDPERVFDPHGRGIALARLSSFDALEYLGNGNEVLATVNRQLGTNWA